MTSDLADRRSCASPARPGGRSGRRPPRWPPPSLKRSPTATPGDPGDLAADGDDRDRPRSERGTPPSLKRSPSVFVPVHAQRLHAVALAPGADLDLAAEAGGVERREPGPGGVDGRRVELGPDLPVRRSGRGPEARSATGCGRGLDLGRDVAKPIVPLSQTALRPPPRSTSPPSGCSAEPQDLGGAAAAEGDGAAGRALGERAQAEAAEAGLAVRAPRRETRHGAGAGAHRARAPRARPARAGSPPRPARPGSRRCCARRPG